MYCSIEGQAGTPKGTLEYILEGIKGGEQNPKTQYAISYFGIYKQN